MRDSKTDVANSSALRVCCGVVGDDLVVRVGVDKYIEALAKPHARAMDFTGRPMKGFVYVWTTWIPDKIQSERLGEPRRRVPAIAACQVNGRFESIECGA